jgi:hypothetical protein
VWVDGRVIWFNSVFKSLKGFSKMCDYKQMSLYMRCMVKVKEKYLMTKYRLAGILLNVMT